jgi:hypothetical protein
MRMARVCYLALLATACAPAAGQPPRSAIAPSTSAPVRAAGPRNPTTEAILEALLRLYMDQRVRSEGDITLQANRMTGYGEQRDRANIVLMVSASYNQGWLDSLVPRGLVHGVCPATNARACEAQVMTSFLSFAAPVVEGDTVATVTIFDRALNPQDCGARRGTPSTGGFMNVTARLRRDGQAWRLVGGDLSSAGTESC